MNAVHFQLPGFDVSDPSVLLVSRLELNLFQLCVSTCFRYLGVVNVYSNGLMAAFKGNTNTTSQAYKSAKEFDALNATF